MMREGIPRASMPMSKITRGKSNMLIRGWDTRLREGSRQSETDAMEHKDVGLVKITVLRASVVE